VSSEQTVKPAVVVFGTAGTATSLTAPTTNTSMPFPLPRQDFTFAITAYGGLVTTTASTTASSTAAAACVVQVSNDGVAWFGISSASATATIMTTATGVVLSLSSAVAVGAAVSGQRYGYMRAVVSVNGTGSASAPIAF
jgi:hypothetical protein